MRELLLAKDTAGWRQCACCRMVCCFWEGKRLWGEAGRCTATECHGCRDAWRRLMVHEELNKASARQDVSSQAGSVRAAVLLRMQPPSVAAVCCQRQRGVLNPGLRSSDTA